MNKIEENVLFDDLIVVKRSGQRVNFHTTKVALAIKKAFDQVMFENSEKQVNKIYEEVLLYIFENYQDRKTIHVEDIQDIIETKLKENKYIEVYQAFSDYRVRRAASRKAFIKQEHKFSKAIERIVRENESRNGYDKPNEILLDFGKTIACEYTKTYILENKFVRAHEEGSLYIHNLDYFYLGKLSSTHLLLEELKEDFPNKLIFKVLEAKNEIDGEIAINALDEELLEYLFKTFRKTLKKTIKKYLEISNYLEYIPLKKVEEIIEKEQSINFDLEHFSSFILNERVKELFELAYNDTMDFLLNELSENIRILLVRLNENSYENKKYSISIGGNNCFEVLMITQCYLKELEKLPRTENVTTIFKVRKENTSEVLGKISELIADGKNIALSFVETSYNKEENVCIEYFSLGGRIFENPIYEEKGSKGRMFVGSISINMGRLGFKYQNKDLKEFYVELDSLLDMTRNGLVEIFETIGNKSKENYQILFHNNILEDEKLESGQKIRKVIKKGVLNIELAGLKECVLNLQETPEKQKDLLLNILSYINEKCKNYTLESKLNFIVSETSKERPLKKLMELDKAIYGIKKGINDKGQYERVDSLFSFKNDLEKDMEHIGKYQRFLSGGNLVKVPLSKNVKPKQIVEIIQVAIQKDVGFLKFEIRK